MNNRSYLDSLNQGRHRRPRASLDELNRTLDQIESRISPPDVRDRADRHRHDDRFAGEHAQNAGYRASPRPFDAEQSFLSLARDIEGRRDDFGPQRHPAPPQDGVSREMKALRDELRREMSTGLREEFDTLRREIENTYASVTPGNDSRDLAAEMERLSQAIQGMASRADDRGIHLLRNDLEQLRDSLASLAREDTVRSMNSRWSEFEQRALDRREPDPLVAALSDRLEQIGSAVANLPDSVALRSLEDKVRTLAGAVDHFSRQNERAAPKSFELIEHRLDEISRAIVASSVAAQPHDREALERIEARVGSLAHHIDILSQDRGTSDLSDRIGGLSQRIEDIARQAAMPERAIESLARQVSTIADILEKGWDNRDREAIVEHLERRFSEIAGYIDDRHQLSASQSQTLFRELDRRLVAVAERLEQGTGLDGDFLHALDARFTELGERIEAVKPSPVQAQMLDGLTRRMAELSQKFDRHASEPAATDPKLLHALDRRFDELGERVEAVKPSAAQTQMLDGLNRRMADLAQKFDSRAGEPAPTDPRLLNALDQRFGELGERIEAVKPSAAQEQVLDGLSRRMGELSQKFDSRAGEPAPTDPRLLNALDQRFSELGERIEANRPSPLQTQLLDGLNRRLGELAEKFERREARQTGTEPELLQALDEKFSELSDRIASASARQIDSSAIDGIGQRLDAIADRVESADRKMSLIDPAVIRNLESQVAGLAAHLAKPQRPGASLEAFVPRLEGIERSISGQRDAIIAAAREAAEHAVRTLGAGSSDSEDAAALAAELKSLESLARKSDERNGRTFEAIHDTLLKVVDRLGSLEKRSTDVVASQRAKFAASSVPPMMPPAAQLAAVDVQEAVAAYAEEKAPEPRMAAPAPRRTPVEAAAAAAAAAATMPAVAEKAAPRKTSVLGGLRRVLAGRTANVAAKPQPKEPVLAGMSELGLDEPLDAPTVDRPLEPGSGAPDLNAIMKRVRDERSASHAADPAAAKADFIAAARRAAQAAASEAETLKRQSAPGKAKRGFAAADFLRARRKPILMAAAAIMIALAGLQLGKAFFASDDGIAGDHTAMSTNSAPLVAAVADVDGDDDGEFAVVDGEDGDTAFAEAEAAAAANAEAESAAESSTAAMQDMPAAQIAAPEAEQAVQEQAVTSLPAVDSAPVTVASLPTEAAAAPAEPTPAATAPAAYTIPLDAGPLPLREAAAAGDAKALFVIGSRYAEGRNGAPDASSAAIWYERAADLGFAPAQYRIGNFYEKGTGVDRDIVKAKTWYQLAANQGNASAMHNLAVLFAMGADGTTDNDSAARWFVEAAELGVKDSQYNLGILAAKGAGVPQSLEESYKWFALVAKTGDKDASAKRDEVANALRPEQLAKARAATDLWKPREVIEQSNSVEVPESWRESDGTTASVDMKKAVKTIQLILNKNGYQAGGADGMMGAKTKQAIMAFQKDNGMAPTGSVDDQLVQALLAKK